MYRTNTYTFIHMNVFHMIMNVLALMPLLERFESEYGTLTSLALFFGRESSAFLASRLFTIHLAVCAPRLTPMFPPVAFSTFPAALYVLSSKYIFHTNDWVMGSSVWFFLLIGMEAVRTYKTNPYFTIATFNIPTWITPLVLVVVVSVLVPQTSFLGHVCGLLVGYFCMSCFGVSC